MSTPEKYAKHLIAIVRGLRVRHTYERSFKLSAGRIHDNRFLFGLRKTRLGNQAGQRVPDIAARLGMPPQLLDEYRLHLPKSGYLHFGFEEQEGSCIYKAYLEFYESTMDKIRALPESAAGPHLMYLGFKWSVDGSGPPVTTQYHWRPGLPLDAISARCGALTTSPFSAPFSRLVQAVLTQVKSDYPDRRIHYMDVHESGNSRRSFDINLYSTGMQVADIGCALSALRSGLDLPAAAFDRLYAQVANSKLGHISSGLSRDGKGFISVYHGVQHIDPAS